MSVFWIVFILFGLLSVAANNVLITETEQIHALTLLLASVIAINIHFWLWPAYAWGYLSRLRAKKRS